MSVRVPNEERGAGRTARHRVSMSLLAAAVAVVLLLPAPAAIARSSAYSAVEHAYATSGTVTPCRFSSPELEAALRQAPTYDLEYFGDFTNAISAALSAQAVGACTPRRTQASAAGLTLVGTPAAPAPPASVTAPTAANPPLALVLAIAAVSAGCLVALLLWLLGATGWEPGWAGTMRHAWREAEDRLDSVLQSTRPRR